jgi:hypothetical protein
MTGAVLDRPGALLADEDAEAGVPDAGAPLVGGGRVTLEELLDRALHAARANGSAECPVCRARMTREAEAALCGGCGSRLS